MAKNIKGLDTIQQHNRILALNKKEKIRNRGYFISKEVQHSGIH